MRRPLLLALTLLGCDEAAPAPARPPAPPKPAPADPTLDAALRYASMCAACHGEVGEGGSGPRLVDTPLTVDALAASISGRMPQGNPGACRGDCPRSLAAYIKATFTARALACEAVAPSPRRLRLLTRREYRSTLRDLLGLTGAAPAAAPAADCNRQRFAYDPAGRALRSVHLAGTFNGWSPTAAPLAWSDAARRWQAELSLPDGSHQYKFVLDGRDWVRDEGNPLTAPDGFGGLNSLLSVRCAAPVAPAPPGGRALAFDPAATLPVETRPQGFAFDTHADVAVVTSTHVSEQLAAAGRVVDALGEELVAAVGCAAADAPTCAERVTGAFGRRAFRRPLTDAESQRYRALVTGAPSTRAGVARAVRAMLVSPSFLYRSEMGEARPDGTFRLTPWETAAALSYTFWGTTPDDALLDAAARGALAAPADLEREARRLLADPRARAQVVTFAMQWLGVEGVATAPRNAALFPDFTDAVRSAMLEETRRLVAHAVFDGTHQLAELFTAAESFVNEPLARFYGMGGVTGEGFQRAAVPAERAGGVLGHGSVLTRYAHSDQGSPILRGVFVRQTLLCQEFPPPPPNAGGVPDVDPRATTRERFAQHTANAACATCHQHIDGIGFGFEHFDAVGRVRATENGRPVDHAGALTDVEGLGAGSRVAFSSVAELGRALASSEAAALCAARQWYRFARGARDTALDRCAVRAMMRRAGGRGGDLRELILSVALTPDFVTRR
jgi:mono/diheme cytochrome c family protein